MSHESPDSAPAHLTPCPFVRAVGEERYEDAIAIARRGPEPADEVVIPVLLGWALDVWNGKPVPFAEVAHG